MGRAIFVDFDGTITDLDTFDVLVRAYAGEDTWAATERSLRDGTMTLRDVLSLQASYVRASFAEVAELLERTVTVDPTFAPFVAAVRARGDTVTIVSSGIRSLIEGRLAAIGLAELPIIANEVVPEPAGWTIRFRDPVPNGTDKAAIVRGAAARGHSTVFIGDGRSDFDAALVAERRFARSGRALETYLRLEGVDFTAFSGFDEVDEALSAAV